MHPLLCSFFFFFNDTATTEIYTLSYTTLFRSTNPNVYAAGDVIGDPMFVYVAAHGGALSAENALTGNERRYDLSALPKGTFTDPAGASVGLTENQARAQGVDPPVSKLPPEHRPRARAARGH